MSDYCNPSKAFDFLDYDFIASAVIDNICLLWIDILPVRLALFVVLPKPIKENEIKNNHTNTPVVLV